MTQQEQMAAERAAAVEKLVMQGYSLKSAAVRAGVAYRTARRYLAGKDWPRHRRRDYV
jgi:transposase